ncbi:hypothetical protein BDW22DRAFT_1480045 [Trametopsis cervina]|nr:hypothetical protein BDW22DRAFT_1480045 [Trametopsis cervina]
MSPQMTEKNSLLRVSHDAEMQVPRRNRKLPSLPWAILVVLIFGGMLREAWIHYNEDVLPSDPDAAAKKVLRSTPVIDSHIDLPVLLRGRFRNNPSLFDLNKPFPGHVDIPRLRKGGVGGFFWSAYTSCSSPSHTGAEFLNSTWSVRDTLEQIDITKLVIAEYDDTFHFATSAADFRKALKANKIAGWIGIEGGHQLGNSIAALRQYYELGVRYVTLTHTCHNAFADSAGTQPEKWGGLSPLGHSLIDELNRLGVLVDISHTSDETARQALKYSKAPVIWSHSSARALYTHERNIPDDILALVGTAKGKTDAVIMVNFVPDFIAAPGKADLNIVADHIEHIASITGKKHVGLGSDFDGINTVPEGLEDVSKYPKLIAELYRRGWNKHELEGLTGNNFIRVFEGAEKVAKKLQAKGTKPVVDLYDKRTDL